MKLISFVVGVMSVFMASILSFSVSATVEHHTIHSKIVDHQYSYEVALPKGYIAHDNQRYPVLYLLEGNTHLDHTKASAQYLTGVDAMPKIIIVSITNKYRLRDFTPSRDAGHPAETGGGKAFQQFLIKELIPTIAKNYSVSGYRMLAGHSLGGLFVIDTMIEHNDVFDAYFAYSPSLWWNEKRLLKNLMLDKSPLNKLKGMAYFSLANEKGKQLTSYNGFVQLLASVDNTDFSWTDERLDKEDHMTTPLASQVNAFRVAFADWLLTFDQVVENPSLYQAFYLSQNKKYGMTNIAPEWLIGQPTQHLLHQLKDKKKGREGADIHLKMFPNSLWAYKGKADSLYIDGKQKQAVEYMQKAVKMAKDKQDSYLSDLESRLDKMKRGTL